MIELVEEQVNRSTATERDHGDRRQLWSEVSPLTEERKRDMSFQFTEGVFKDRWGVQVTEIEWDKFIRFYLNPGKHQVRPKGRTSSKKASSIKRKKFMALGEDV
jgi:hypothetical protein